MIRVFPRRTKWTPRDPLAFVGDPPLFRPPDQPVKISVLFTWDKPEAERLKRAWSDYYSDVEIGGPAYGAKGDEFIPGQFVKPGVTITSRGCIRKCAWCFVPKREGKIRELKIKDGWDVIDNNLLACSKKHIDVVFNMLKRQSESIKFSGGLDARLLEQWHVDLLKAVKLEFAWFSCDYPGSEKYLERVADLMSDFHQRKKRCYVLIGFNGETPKEAEARLLYILRLGFDPFAMYYRGDGKTDKPRDWALLQRRWTRPGAYRMLEKRHAPGLDEHPALRCP
jgi:hypothetical protein